MRDKLIFKGDPNNKLSCKAFCTLRLLEKEPYKVGDLLIIKDIEKGFASQTKGRAVVKSINFLTGSEISEPMALLDYGLDLGPYLRALGLLYQKTEAQILIARFQFLTLKYT